MISEMNIVSPFTIVNFVWVLALSKAIPTHLNNYFKGYDLCSRDDFIFC